MFNDFDLGPQCEEVYFADHDYFWDEDSDCYIRKEYFDEIIQDRRGSDPVPFRFLAAEEC